MMLDMLAWGVLVSVYTFGGAAFWCTDQTRYRDALFGWVAINTALAAACGVIAAVLWALTRVLT